MKIIRLVSALMVALTLVLTGASAFAHERRGVGVYEFVVGHPTFSSEGKLQT